MATEQKTLIERLKEGYEKAKKPIAYAVMLVALALQSLPAELLPEGIRDVASTGLLLAFALILLEMLFEIYEKIVREPRGVNVINSNDLYREIHQIVSNEREVEIQHIGLAGRHGWQNVLEKLLNDSGPDALMDKVKFDVEIALLDPARCTPDDPTFGRFEMVGALSRQSDHFVYNKSDDFGGQECITRFQGWFNHIRAAHLAKAVRGASA